MKTVAGNNGRKYAVESLVKLVRGGSESVDQIAARCGDKVAAAVARELGKPNSITLYGRIARRTDAAVLFVPAATHQGTAMLAKFAECWLPLSQVKVAEDALAGMDSVSMPGWLLDAKNSEAAQ